MHFYRSAVERANFHFYADDLLLLHQLEDPCQHARFAPAHQARIDGMPITEFLRKFAPLRPIFRDVKNRIQCRKIAVFDTATMLGKTVRYPFVLLFGQLHFPSWRQAPLLGKILC